MELPKVMQLREKHYSHLSTINDYMIIGGGIAGLYCAKLLNDHHSKYNINKSITIIESTSRLGGRIQTKYIDTIDVLYESGASIFMSDQTHINSLIKEFEIKVEAIDDVTQYRSMNKPQSKPIDIDYDKYLKVIGTFLNKNKNDPMIYNDLMNKNLYDFLKKYIDDGNFADNFIDQSLYIDIIVETNAYNGILLHVKEFSKKNKDHVNNIYGVVNGMIEIINNIHDNIIHNVKIEYDSEVVGVSLCDNVYEIITSHGKSFYCNNVIFACPKNSLKKIYFNFLKNTSEKSHLYYLINSVNDVPLMRVYCTYPFDDNNKCWFNDIKAFTTESPIKMVAPINPNKGFIMIAYGDSINADILYDKHKKGILRDYLDESINKIMMNQNIPHINDIWVEYWHDGVHYWKVNVNHEKIYKEILKPFTNHNIYICGESYSLDQGWIEGALATAYNVVDLLLNN
jgi:predicted NAD/FAD-dependent oxidoreductase